MTEQSAITTHGPPVSVDICPECRGLWLDAQKLAAVCPPRRRSPVPQDGDLAGRPRGRQHPCLPPCCAVPYEFALMDGMLVDFCPGCAGVWLDGDEYEESAFEPASPPRARERSPYHAAADRLERRSEVNCQDCAPPPVVARSYIWEHGFLCRGC